MPGHSSSRAVLARMIRSKESPGREKLISASRSATLKELEEIRMEASQPSTMQSWKKRRRVPAAGGGNASCFSVMSCCMISWNFGDVLLL